MGILNCTHTSSAPTHERTECIFYGIEMLVILILKELLLFAYCHNTYLIDKDEKEMTCAKEFQMD